MDYIALWCEFNDDINNKFKEYKSVNFKTEIETLFSRVGSCVRKIQRKHLIIQLSTMGFDNFVFSSIANKTNLNQCFPYFFITCTSRRKEH